jgi:anti-anti-sigma factor
VSIEVHAEAGRVRRVVVDGDLDWEQSVALQDCFNRIPSSELGTLVLDAGRLGFVDSGGLRALIQGRRVADRAGASFVIENASPALHRLLELTGIDHLFGAVSRVGPGSSRNP